MTHIVNIIIILGLGGVAIILFLLLKTGVKVLSKRILTFIFGLCLIPVLSFYADLHSIDWLENLLHPINYGNELFFGPLLFLYVQSLYLNTIPPKRVFIHFFPLIIFFLLFIFPVYISILQEEYLFYYLELMVEGEWDMFIFLLYFIIYNIISYQTLIRFNTISKVNHSSVEGYNFDWTQRLLIGVILLNILDLLLLCIDVFTPELGWIDVFFDFVPSIILIIYMGYYGFKQSDLKVPNAFIYLQESDLEDSANKVSYSLKPNEIEMIRLGLKENLDVKKYYLDENLTLASLASRIPTTDKKLSIYINHELKTNFYDLINKCRINTFKEKLQMEKYQNYTLIAIAYESGFQSKASFNRVFKKETGLTPLAYKKKYQLIQ